MELDIWLTMLVASILISVSPGAGGCFYELWTQIRT